MDSNAPKLWIVLDSITKIQSQPMTDQQLQMSILRMHEKDWDRFFIWTESWEDWQPLRAFLKSDQKNFLNVLNITKTKDENDKTITKSMTRVRAQGEQTNTSFKVNPHESADMDQIDVANIKPPENLDFKKIKQQESYRNRATRHDLKIEILLISKTGKTFRSYSKNISLSGSLLEDNIPFDYYGGPFDVVVVNRHAKDASASRVQAKGITVGDGVTRRIKFEPLSEAAQNRLVFLLNEYLEHQKKATKKAS